MKYIALFLGLWPLAMMQSQEMIEPDSTVVALTKFETVFYDAVTQKSLENYDKAIQILLNNQDLKENKEVLMYELARNYFLQKDYTQAGIYYQKTLDIKPNFRWALDGLFQINKQIKNYPEAIKYLKLLSEISSEYKEELVQLYMFTNQHDEALALINELNDNFGKRAHRTALREQILKLPKYQNLQKQTLEKAINKNSNDPSDYVALIVQYANNNEFEKSFNVAKQLQEAVPNSPWSQVYLFKDYLNKKQPENAWQALEKSLQSDEVYMAIKHMMFNEWLVAQKNYPDYEATIVKSVNYLITDPTVAVAKEVGKFYQNKQQWQNAAKFYEMHHKNNPDDLENILLWCGALKQSNLVEVLQEKATEWQMLYPSQPQFYWFQAYGLLKQNQPKKAQDFLLEGIDYVIDNPALERDFYLLLIDVFTDLNDQKNKEKYQKLIKP